MNEDVKQLKHYYALIKELKIKRNILNNNLNSNIKNDYQALLDSQLREINNSCQEAIAIQNDYKKEHFNADKIICVHSALIIIAIILVFKINTLNIEGILNIVILKLSVIFGNMGLLAVGINNLFNSCNILEKLETKFQNVLIIKNNKDLNIKDANLCEKLQHEVSKNKIDYNTANRLSVEEANKQITIINNQIQNYYSQINYLLIKMQDNNKEIKALLDHYAAADADIKPSNLKLSQEKSQTM